MTVDIIIVGQAVRIIIISPSIILYSYTYAETQRKNSDRVLVFSELGVSRAATAVTAYLMKRNKWSLKVSFQVSSLGL